MSFDALNHAVAVSQTFCSTLAPFGKTRKISFISFCPFRRDTDACRFVLFQERTCMKGLTTALCLFFLGVICVSAEQIAFGATNLEAGVLFAFRAPLSARAKFVVQRGGNNPVD